MAENNDDEELAIRMMCGDKEALREVLKRHLEPVRELLIGTYGTTVQRCDIDDALWQAIDKMWRAAGTYSKDRASLEAWLFIMAQSVVIDVFRREKRHRQKHPLLKQDFDVAAPCDDHQAEEQLTKEERQDLKDLKYIIEHKLKGHQQTIIKADLAAGGTADAGSLAEMLGTTKDSIYVSRHKAHETIRKEMTQLAQQRERLRGKK